MNTYEACFKNSIGGYIDFDVQAETEEEAKKKAFDEMESEGFEMDSSLSDGYCLHSIHKKKQTFEVFVEKLITATSTLTIEADDKEEAERIANQMMYDIPNEEWDVERKGEFNILSSEITY